MLDVHPPDEPAHSWKDFLLHIATICVGLLIAIGLEQTVEAIHRAHERRDLREELHHESEQIEKDSKSCVKASFASANWSASVLLAMAQAARDKHSMTSLPQPTGDNATLPSDPIFRGAMASNRLALLTREEVEAFSEIRLLVHDLEEHEAKENEANLDFNVDFAAMSFGMDVTRDILPQATTEDLRAPYRSMVRAQRAYINTGTSCYVLHGAAKAVLDGERDLGKIEAAEEAAQKKLFAQLHISQKVQGGAAAPAPEKK